MEDFPDSDAENLGEVGKSMSSDPMVRKGQELDKEYNALINSQEFAFAMGHGCTIGGANPTLVAIRQRASNLRAQRSEYIVKDSQ
jgi:hypothetical protein